MCVSSCGVFFTPDDGVIFERCTKGLATHAILRTNPIPTRGNLFLPVRLLVCADGRGTVEQADTAARAELQGLSKQKLQQLKNIQKYHWV
jgi:hypothetical protein